MIPADFYRALSNNRQQKVVVFFVFFSTWRWCQCACVRKPSATLLQVDTSFSDTKHLKTWNISEYIDSWGNTWLIWEVCLIYKFQSRVIKKLIPNKNSNSLLLLPASLRQQMFRGDTNLNPLRKQHGCHFIKENNLLARHYLIFEEYWT